MKKMRVLALCLTLAILLAACGDRSSGFSPAENAVTANPEDTIALRARDYELPPATPAPDGPTASYDTGDSSGGRTLTLDTLNPALERAAAGTADEVAAAVAENALEDGRSTTIADETSEGDAAEATGGDLNVVTDPTETPTDTVVDPATSGETEVAGEVEEVGAEETPTDETEVEPADEDVTEVENASSAASAVTETETGGAVATETVGAEDTDEVAATETGGAATEDVATENVATDEVTTAAETGGAADAAATQSAPAQASGEVLAQASSFDWEELGTKTYVNCSACHQQNGEGIVGAFPPLAGHINELYNADGGRKYIVNVVLYGLQGELEALGQSYNGLMTPWGQLSNEEIAATLNHELTSWGNDALVEDFSPILPDEVEVERANNLSAAQVLELRPELP